TVSDELAVASGWRVRGERACSGSGITHHSGHTF
ncbi:hypothetical protein A2U01_0027591, partial [Trifolium medium]|nr:hypothetical protein [Trifolium medium]